MESRNRDKVVTSPADYSSAECNLFARRGVESLGRWAADNAKHKIQTLVFILLSLLVNIRNYPLSSLHLVTLCLSPKNGKHTFKSISPHPTGFLRLSSHRNRNGTSHPVSHHFLLRPVTAGTPLCYAFHTHALPLSILSANLN